MTSALTTIVPVPLWMLLLVMVLLAGGNIATTLSARALRDLFRVYWKQTYDEDLE